MPVIPPVLGERVLNSQHYPLLTTLKDSDTVIDKNVADDAKVEVLSLAISVTTNPLCSTGEVMAANALKASIVDTSGESMSKVHC